MLDTQQIGLCCVISIRPLAESDSDLSALSASEFNKTAWGVQRGEMTTQVEILSSYLVHAPLPAFVNQNVFICCTSELFNSADIICALTS